MLGAREVVHRLHILTECRARTSSRVVCGRHGLPLNPFGRGVRLENRLQLPTKRRRHHGFGANSKPRSRGRGLRRQAGANRRDERAPRSNLTELDNRLRAIGVVKRQERGLRVEIGCAKASRMIGVALGLRGASLMAFDQEARRDAAESHGGREEQWTAGDYLLGFGDRVRVHQLVGLNR